MKKLIIILMLMCAFTCNITANQTARVTTSMVTRAAKDTLVTKEVYTDKQGTKYPIIINKASGRCYVWKKSGTSGKLYPMYLKEKKAREICQKYHIEYK